MLDSLEIPKRNPDRRDARGRHTLTICEMSAKDAGCEATLHDLSEGGLAMDCPQYFWPDTIVQIEGKLQAGRLVMHLVSRSRVTSCERISLRLHRVGVEFLYAEYKPVLS